MQIGISGGEILGEMINFDKNFFDKVQYLHRE